MKGKVLLAIVGLVVVCVSGFGIVASMASPRMVNPQDGSINMVQPCGWFWCAQYDQHYAQQVNVPNSDANQNNAQANALNAQATLTVSQSQEQQRIAARSGEGMGVLIGGAFTCVIAVIALMAILTGLKYAGGGS